MVSRCIATMSSTQSKYRSFALWKTAHKTQRAIFYLVRKVSIHDRKRMLRRGLELWRGELRRQDRVRVIRTFLRSLNRHGTVADAFLVWKRKFCDLYYPRKVAAVKSIWRRYTKVRAQYLQTAFSSWKCRCELAVRNKRSMYTMTINLRKYYCRTAFRLWNDSIDNIHSKRRLLYKVFDDFSNKSVYASMSLCFSRWLSFSIEIEKQKHTQSIRHNEMLARKAHEEYSNNTTGLIEEHYREKKFTMGCVKQVMTAMQLLSYRHKRLHRLMVAFRRWAYLDVVRSSVKNTTANCYTRRTVMILFARLKEKRQTAFMKWKDFVSEYHIKRNIVNRMIVLNCKRNVMHAFGKWKEFRHMQHIVTLSKHISDELVKNCVMKWQNHRIYVPFRRWKEVIIFLSRRDNVIRRVVSTFRLHFFRVTFQKWHRATVLHDLLEQKMQLQRRQAAQMKVIDKFLSVVPSRIMDRMMIRWKAFHQYSKSLKRAVFYLTNETYKKYYRSIFSKWRHLFRLRQKNNGGLRMLNSLDSGANCSRIIKHFNQWVRFIADHKQKEQSQAIANLEMNLTECMNALQTSRSQCGDANNTISELMQANNYYEVAIRKDEECKNSFAFCMSNKKNVIRTFNKWRERFYQFKHNKSTFCRALRHLLARLDTYCIHQKFSCWKKKVSRCKLFLKIFKMMDLKLVDCNVRNAFRIWYDHSVRQYVLKLTRALNDKSLQMRNEVCFHQQERENMNLKLSYWNIWKSFVKDSLRQKRKMYECAATLANYKMAISFRKWKVINTCTNTLLLASQRLKNVKKLMGFMRWKQIHDNLRQEDNALSHRRKCQLRLKSDLMRRWQLYCHFLKIQRSLFRSLLVTCEKRFRAIIQLSFLRWKAMMKDWQTLDLKSCYVEQHTRQRRLQKTFTQWFYRANVKQSARKYRETVVYGVSHSLPVVKDVYDTVLASDDIDKTVELATLAIERILPQFNAEIYVMVSNTMLRASVPLKNSVNGISSRFASNLFDKETRPSPINFQSSPIMQQIRSEMGSPRSQSLSHIHDLPLSSGGNNAPWTEEKPRGGKLFHTPYDQRLFQDDDNTEIVSVIVGRGNVGKCAKTGTYQVYREISSSSFAIDQSNRTTSVSNDVVCAVVPLISSGSIVGVLQLTPCQVRMPSDSNQGSESPVMFKYPSLASTGVALSYPFPNLSQQPSMRSNTREISRSLSDTTLPSAHVLHKPGSPLPPPQFTELVNMCLDMKFTEINTISELCIVVGSLSDALRVFIDGNVKKTDYLETAAAEKEKLETYIAQLHGEVATFEKSVDESTKRIQHLEKSRLKYFNEFKAFKEKAESLEQNFDEVSENLKACQEKLHKYESKERTEDVVMKKLHRSLTKASIEVFGTPAELDDDVNAMTNHSLANETKLHDESRNNLSHQLSSTFPGGGDTNRDGLDMGARDFYGQRGIEVNTSTPSTHVGMNTLNTLTTFDSSSRFSPSRSEVSVPDRRLRHLK